MITPLPLLMGMVVWLIVYYGSRYVSLASIIFAISLPVFAWLFGLGAEYCVFTLVIGGLIIFRHRGNIGRLLQGKENRFFR